MGTRTRWLLLYSLLYLVSAGIGAAYAIRHDLPANFGGFIEGDDILQSFLTGNGTALSASLPYFILQVICILLVPRPGRIGTYAAAGLTILGAMWVVFQIGEPIILRAFNPASFDLVPALILASNMVLGSLMFVFGLLEWRSRRKVRTTA